MRNSRNIIGFKRRLMKNKNAQDNILRIIVLLIFPFYKV